MSAHHWLPVPKGVDHKIDSWLLGFVSAVKMVIVNRYPKTCLGHCHSRSVEVGKSAWSHRRPAVPPVLSACYSPDCQGKDENCGWVCRSAGVGIGAEAGFELRLRMDLGFGSWIQEREAR